MGAATVRHMKRALLVGLQVAVWPFYAVAFLLASGLLLALGGAVLFVGLTYLLQALRWLAQLPL
ncbi:MAG: hypothetical protein JWO74_2311 [Solirubrobacterales bacterium]|jgi:hypothetical protein|nr:hypothetical protein [Solirubrobacterales bacterium]